MAKMNVQMIDGTSDLEIRLWRWQRDARAAYKELSVVLSKDNMGLGLMTMRDRRKLLCVVLSFGPVSVCFLWEK